MDRSQEYRWYLVGCQRLDRDPMSESEFSTLWQEYEDYAEALKAAEAAGTLADLEPAQRLGMERKIQADPILKAVLIGQSEDQGNG